jgi:energy-converting hydrogenase B subunit D
MTLILPLLTLVLCLAILVAAIVCVRSSSTPIAILSAGLVSLLASVVFLLLAAPDVAMTEAAIGSGLTTFLFFFFLIRMRRGDPVGPSARERETPHD